MNGAIFFVSGIFLQIIFLFIPQTLIRWQMPNRICLSNYYLNNRIEQLLSCLG